jgi:hypothetical protein
MLCGCRYQTLTINGCRTLFHIVAGVQLGFQASEVSKQERVQTQKSYMWTKKVNTKGRLNKSQDEERRH